MLAASPWSRCTWLVLAPHPDDETLGAGALIAETASQGRLAGIAYLTDGAGSHPAGTSGLPAARRAEAAMALTRLTGQRRSITWIGWPDAAPFAADDRRFDRDARRFAALLRRLRVDALAVTAAAEPHCDHAAAYRFARAALALAKRRVALFTYHVWSSPPATGRSVRTHPMPAGQRRHALRAHRSQLTPSMGPGFRLPPAQRRMAAHDILFWQRPSA